MSHLQEGRRSGPIHLCVLSKHFSFTQLAPEGPERPLGPPPARGPKEFKKTWCRRPLAAVGPGGSLLKSAPSPPKSAPLPKSAPPQEVPKSAPLCTQRSREAPSPAETDDRAPPDFPSSRRTLAPALRPARGSGVSGRTGFRPPRRPSHPDDLGLPGPRAASPAPAEPARRPPAAPRAPRARAPLYPYIRAYTWVWGFV